MAAPEDIAARRQTVKTELADGRNPFLSPSTGPRVFADQGIITVAWDAPEQIQLDFDFIRTDRHGETSAELTVYTTSAADTRELHRTRLNLLSTIAQDRLAKHLSERAKHLGLNWGDMLATASQLVLHTFRAGEQPVFLRDVIEPNQGEPILAPILLDDGATIIFGDGGTGKSHLALALAASLHTGQPLVAGLTPTRTMRVAYCDWEWSAHVHRRRLARLWGSETELPDLLYVPCRQPLSEERDRLRRYIRDFGLEYLVLDSVGLAAGGEPESAEVAIAFFGALRTLALPSLCVAHVTNAAARTSADRPFGSAFWHNSARSTWYVRKSDSSKAGEMIVGLFNRKANEGAQANPLGLSFRFDPDLTIITKTAIGKDADLDAQRPLRARIADVLLDGPHLVHEVAEQLDADKDLVGKTLRRGEARYFIRLTRPDGLIQWALKASEEG